MIKNGNDVNATKSASELEEDVLTKYRVEVDRLKLIVGRLQSLCDEIVKQSPSDFTRRQSATIALVNEILEKDEVEGYSVKDKLEEIYKIGGEDGFNLDDVLNPKEELNLMDLCRELGIKK